MDNWITDWPISPKFPLLTRGNAGEVLPDPCSPLGWTLVMERRRWPALVGGVCTATWSTVAGCNANSTEAKHSRLVLAMLDPLAALEIVRQRARSVLESCDGDLREDATVVSSNVRNTFPKR